MFPALFDAYLSVLDSFRRDPERHVDCRRAAPEALPPLPIGRKRRDPARRPMIVGCG